MTEILKIVTGAFNAKNQLFNVGSEIKDEALIRIAQGIEQKREAIFKANALDLENAKKLLEDKKITKAVYDRLKLDENKRLDMIRGVHDVMRLDDPVNKVLWTRELDKGLVLKKVSSPIGLVGVIFEARPDVIIQVASLAIKSGNCVILKGGKEAENTNKALYSVIKQALARTKGFPAEAVSLVFSHEDIKELLVLDEYIDLIIPRGSNELVKYIQENTKIPVLGHASGICHIFINSDAKKETAQNIVLDSKTQYPSACNSIETLLVHESYPYLSELKEFLTSHGVKIVENPEKFDIEYSDKILALKVVKSLDEAIEHINKYGSHHTDSIITEDKNAAEKFMTMVDSSGVFHNVSTRFSDGYRYGFGAEVGISTNKIPARGPVGIEGLTTYKYKLYGEGQIVDDYVKGAKRFNHKNI